MFDPPPPPGKSLDQRGPLACLECVAKRCTSESQDLTYSLGSFGWLRRALEAVAQSSQKIFSEHSWRRNPGRPLPIHDASECSLMPARTRHCGTLLLLTWELQPELAKSECTKAWRTADSTQVWGRQPAILRNQFASFRRHHVILYSTTPRQQVVSTQYWHTGVSFQHHNCPSFLRFPLSKHHVASRNRSRVAGVRSAQRFEYM